MKNTIKLLPLALASAFLIGSVTVNAEVNATETVNQEASELNLNDSSADSWWGFGRFGGYGLGLGYGLGWGGYGFGGFGGCCGGFGYGLYY